MFRQIKSFIQRGRRGWADEDVWDFDDYLCDIIVDGIKLLKKANHGCPSDLYDASNTNNECAQWESILEEIIQGFIATKEIKGMECIKWVKTEKGLTRELDEELLKHLTKKHERGMELFSKYFMNLWD